MEIGFHASHEQFSPSRLLELVQQAEQAGFQMVLSSDHFHPWSNIQGESGYCWSWLGAAMQATGMEYGVVNAPGQRYHPAIIAQAVATLDELFPGRFWMAAGSGQALNERITGDPWPAKAERNERLEEAVGVIRRLWSGDYVSHHGRIRVENARLFTKPTHNPKIFGAALTEKTAAWIPRWADGLITISKSLEELKKMLDAFRENGGEGSTLALKVQVSYDPSEDFALEDAWEQWRNNIFPSKLLSEIPTPEQFDSLGEKVRKEDIKKHVLVSNDPGMYIEAINRYRDLGFNKIIFHNVNNRQEGFIDFFGRKVLPELF